MIGLAQDIMVVYVSEHRSKRFIAIKDPSYHYIKSMFYKGQTIIFEVKVLLYYFTKCFNPDVTQFQHIIIARKIHSCKIELSF